MAGLLQSTFTDYYQISMAYAYWKAGRNNELAVFELFFRKNPFKGEFTVYAGVTDCIKLLKNFRFSAEDIEYLKTIMPPSVDRAFFDYLLHLDTTKLAVWSVVEGTVVFPNVPLLQVEGPVIICQLIETALLNSVNFASLMVTNTVRYRLAGGSNRKLYEFGMRRAQGPDGALSASRYAYMGGADGTSNVLAGRLYGIPVVGTHAHSFVSSFQADVEEFEQLRIEVQSASTDDNLLDLSIKPLEWQSFIRRCWHWSKQLAQLIKFVPDQVHLGEMNAFANYALAFPSNFLALIDTYDILNSGLPNYCAVSLALYESGYRAVGIRIDSGDLVYLALMTRNAFKIVGKHYNLPWFEKMKIIASNDLDEDTLDSFNHEAYDNVMDGYGVGTNLVTCQKQPALGCVYKLVEINHQPTMKLSADVSKQTLPGRKAIYRLYCQQGEAVLDLMQRTDEDPPLMHKRILCRHPSEATKRVFVIPSKVEEMLQLVWKAGEQVVPMPTLDESRQRVKEQIQNLRPDYKRLINPTTYKVSVSDDLYNFTQDLRLKMTPIVEIN